MDSLQDLLHTYHAQLLKNLPRLPEAITDQYQVFCCLKESENKFILKLTSLQTKAPVILKCCRKNTQEAALIENEYHIIKKLNNEGIHSVPQAYTLYYERDYIFMLEQFIDGYSLLDLVECGKTFTQFEIASIGMQICQIVSSLHNRPKPLIHNDLSPSNLILSEGIIYLIDFETVKEFTIESCKNSYQIGTIGFSSPEQYASKLITIHSDIYSIGCILSYLATQSTDLSLLVNTSLSESFKQCIERCTLYDPDKRYSSVNDLQRILKKQLY